jgi:hypothetical protein
MKNGWKWAGIFLAVFVIVFLFALPVFGFNLFGHTYAWMPMMRGYGFPFGYGGFGILGGLIMAFFMLLVPLAFIALVVAAVFGVVRLASGGGSRTAALTRTCIHCGKPLQADWSTCPYCGQKI